MDSFCLWFLASSLTLFLDHQSFGKPNTITPSIYYLLINARPIPLRFASAWFF